MSVTVDLSPEVERWLEEEAARRGLSISTFVETVISDLHRRHEAVRLFAALCGSMANEILSGSKSDSARQYIETVGFPIVEVPTIPPQERAG